MSPRASASSRRQSFSSVDLAKEAAGSTTIVKKAGLKGLTKRHWIPAALLYALSMTGASVGFYYLGDSNNSRLDCVKGTNSIPRFYPVGPVTDVDGTHYVFRDGLVAHSWKGDDAKDLYVTNEKYDKYIWDHKFETVEGYMPGGPVSSQRVATAASTLTKRKRDLPAPTSSPEVVNEVLDDAIHEVVEVLEPGSESDPGSDSDSDVVVVEEAPDSGSDDEVVVVEEEEEQDSGSDSDGPTEVTLEEEDAEPDVVEVHDETAPADVVEVHDETAEPDVVEVHDPTAEPDVEVHDEAPEILIEESSVESDSDFINLAHRSADNNGDFSPDSPFAVGNQPKGFSGQGDRYITHGIRRRPNVPGSYVGHLEIPKGPQAHRAVADTERGGFRIADPYYPAAAPKVHHHVADPGPAVVTAASNGDAPRPSQYVVTITLPFEPHATHSPAN